MRERKGPGEIVLQRRNTQRIPLRVEITYQVDCETLSASTANLTSAGCFVETETPVPNDSLVNLTLHLSDDPEPVKASGHIVRVQRRQDDQPGFAVVFDCIDKETCERIDDLNERAAAPRGFDEDY
jgi:uncharacterized protein (TIGR02266 family)